MKALQDLCLYLAARARQGQISDAELVTGLEQVLDLLPRTCRGMPAHRKVQRARTRLTRLLRSARSLDAEERRDVRGAHLDLEQIARSFCRSVPGSDEGAS